MSTICSIKKLYYFFLIPILWVFTFPIQSKTIYVNPQQSTRIQTGESWEHSFSTIQQALAIAEPGAKIVLAQGRYHETNLKLANNIILLGGFHGFGANANERDWIQYATIIDGNQQSDTILSVSGAVIIDGLVITQSSATALLCHHSSPLIRNCRFIKNNGLYEPIVRIESDSKANIYNCDFLENLSKSCSIMSIQNASPNIKQCTFSYNSTTHGKGGAVTIHTDAAPSFEQCSFDHNSGDSAGAVYSGADSMPIFAQCVFRWNRANNDGGSVYCENSAAQFKFCLFEWNQVERWGGALMTRGSNLLIESATFRKKPINRV